MQEKGTRLHEDALRHPGSSVQEGNTSISLTFVKIRSLDSMYLLRLTKLSVNERLQYHFYPPTISP